MKRLFFFSLLLVFSLVLSAVTPGLVYAEGDIPEEPAPEPPVVEETPPEDTGSTVELLAESGAVIADPGGDLVPLASQAALDVVCDPDPWFYCSVGCVGGKSPVYGTFSAAFSNWAGLKGYGFLYVQGSAVPYTINDVSLFGGIGSPFNTMTGIVWEKTGLKPLISGTLELQGFTKGFTVQGINFTANSSKPALKLVDTTGTIKLVDISVTNTGGTGIMISNHKGAIAITNVNANDNLYNGADITNIFWDNIIKKYVNAGNVTITNSAFLRNGGPGSGGNAAGLAVSSSGNIVLTGVTVSGNAGDGADFGIYGNSLLIRNSVFSGNVDNPLQDVWGYGIWTANYPDGNPAAITLDNVVLAGNNADGAFLTTGGNIILNRVYAANNGSHGVYISGDYNADSVGAKNVTVINSTFAGNQNHNLQINASGSVKLTNLYSTKSVNGSGLFVNNYNYTTLPMPVTVLGAVLSGNKSSGGYIGSLGTITLAGITAQENESYGMFLDNQWSGSTSSIVISSSLGLNRFNDNKGVRGLTASTYGNVSLSSVQANGNTGGGVYVGGYGLHSNISLLNLEASGNLGAAFPGLNIFTSGNVVLNKVTALNNGGEGISIDNNHSSYSLLVTINSSTASGNGKEGFKVLSLGAITLSGVTASGNALDGANLVNSYASPLAKGITVSRSTFDLNQSVGLRIDTLRKITLTSINASDNATNGVYGFNGSSTVGSPIVVSGTNRFYHNGTNLLSSGVYLNSQGLITLSGIVSAWNGMYGVSANTAMGVTAANIQVLGNTGSGLLISSNGAVTLGGITALQNGTVVDKSGVEISNISGKVTVTSGLIMGNGRYGLEIDVAGATEAERKLKVSIAPGVVVFGNDVVSPYQGKQIEVY